jgi:hypothetical protein
MLMRQRSAVGAMLFLFVIAACSERAPEQGAGSAGAADTAATPAPTAPTAAVPADTLTPVTAEVTLDHAKRIAVDVREWQVRMSEDSVKSGDYALVIANKGGRPHTIEVKGDNGARWRTIPLAPGGSVTLSMTLPPGHYQIASTDSAYVERGMRAALVVVIP